MRGNAKIINSERDAQHVGLTYEQVIAMATIVVRYDDAQYPPDYDSSLQDGDEGYVEPIWRFEEEIDNSVLKRFGFKLR
ncbi:hypothetical protein ACOKSH_12975 [Vibrio cholerae]